MGNRLKMFADVMAFHQEVSGSCILCSVRFPDREQIKFLVDFGLYFTKESDREGYIKKNSELSFNPEDISFVLVTHGHADHIGRLPYLVRSGFTGTIYATHATKKILPFSLNDSVKILKEKFNREHKKSIYSTSDIYQTMDQVCGVDFYKKIEITQNIAVTFIENAHIIGASMILVEITYPDEEPITLFFSGDYGTRNDFFDVDEIPEAIRQKRISTFICESTYGTTSRDDEEVGLFKELLLNEVENGKNNIIIPVLALGRAQQILYELKKLQDSNDLSTELPIFFDGKLAQKYTRVYLDENEGFIKKEMKDFLPKNLTWVYKEERMRLLENKSRKIIVTTSGMGNHGAAKTYIPYFCDNANSSLIFTCFLPDGTVGAKLFNAEKGEKISVFGLMKEKNSDVYQTPEFSSHARSEDIIELLQKFSELKSVLVNHGEEDVKESFASKVFDVVETKSVGILNRDYVFRIGAYGVDKTIPTKFSRY